MNVAVIHTYGNDNKLFELNENEEQSRNYIKQKLNEFSTTVYYHLLLEI
jgi:hypothetical protein